MYRRRCPLFNSGSDVWTIFHSFYKIPSYKSIMHKDRNISIRRLFGDPITMDYPFGWTRKTKTENRGHYYHAQSCVMEKKVLYFTCDTFKKMTATNSLLKNTFKNDRFFKYSELVLFIEVLKWNWYQQTGMV